MRIETYANVGDMYYIYLEIPHHYFHNGKMHSMKGVVPFQISSISISVNKKEECKITYRGCVLDEGQRIDIQRTVRDEDFGKKVFRTKEEAVMVLGIKNPETIKV